MTDIQLTVQETGEFLITGALDFTTVDALLSHTARLFTGADPVVLDLAGVNHANSAGLALLLEWQDRAQRLKRRVQVRNMPVALADIARLSNCLSILDCA